MGRLCITACVLAGCFNPTPSPGGPCSPLDGTCPGGLTCVAGTCQLGPGDVEVDAAVDAPAIDAAIDAPGDPPLQPWSSPVLVPGVNSSAADEDPSVTADQLTIVFVSNRVTATDRDIYLGTRASVAEPFIVAPLAAVNSASNEKSPEISGDGNTLYFTSTRTGAGDIYVSTRTGGVWSTPALVTELSSTAVEEDVAISPDGLTVLLSRTNQLVLTTRATLTGKFGAPALVAALNISADVSAPSLTGTAAYFHSGAPRDLYVAKREGGGFAPPAPITELNSTARDASPFVSADDKHVWFERAGQLYESSR